MSKRRGGTEKEDSCNIVNESPNNIYVRIYRTTNKRLCMKNCVKSGEAISGISCLRRSIFQPKAAEARLFYKYDSSRDEPTLSSSSTQYRVYWTLHWKCLVDKFDTSHALATSDDYQRIGITPRDITISDSSSGPSKYNCSSNSVQQPDCTFPDERMDTATFAPNPYGPPPSYAPPPFAPNPYASYAPPPFAPNPYAAYPPPPPPPPPPPRSRGGGGGPRFCHINPHRPLTHSRLFETARSFHLEGPRVRFTMQDRDSDYHYRYHRSHNRPAPNI
jgi:hypothetical protein